MGRAQDELACHWMTGLTNMRGLYEYPNNRSGGALMLKVTSKLVRHL
jgi:hypothetical protein